MNRFEAEGFQRINEEIALGCDCNVSFWFAADPNEVTEVRIEHEDHCRLLELADRMS